MALEDILRQTGVYEIRNLVNGKSYIGSTSSSFGKRLRNHRNALEAGTHPVKYLQNAWNKHGSRCFRFSILEVCPPHLCVQREQKYIDESWSWMFEFGYNRRKLAGSNLGIKLKASTKRKLSQAKRGKPKSEEHKRKISEALKGLPKSVDHKQSMSRVRLRKSRPLDFTRK